MNMNLFFVGYDFPDRIPLGEAGSNQTMAANYNDIVSLLRHQFTLDKEKNQEIARLKQQQQQQQQQQQKV